MPESSKAKTRSVLLLDNRQADAQLVCELLQNLPHWQLDVTVHLYSEGIFPTAGSRFDLLLVTDDYAGSKLSQIVDIAKFYQPHAHLVLLGTTPPGARSPQEFIDAGRAGVSYWLQKDNLSPAVLHAMLQQIFSASKQQTEAVGAELPASDLPAADAPTAEATNNNKAIEQADLIVEQISVGVIIFGIVDDGFIYRRINFAAAEFTQLQPLELIGKRLSNDATFFESFNLHNALRQVSATAAAQTHRVMNLIDDATASWRDVVIRPLHADLLVEIHDTTERVELAAQRRYSEKIWWHIAKSLPDLCATVDADGSVNQVIAGEWQQLNIDSKTLAGQPITAILAPEEREHCSASIQKALNTGKTQTAVYALDSTENQARLHVKVALLHAEVDAPRQVLWLARDLNGNHAEPHTAADAFGNTQELLNELLQRAPFMAAISNADGRYEHVNAACTQRLQQSAEAVIGKTDAELFTAEIAHTLQQLDRKLLTEGTAQQSDITSNTHCEVQKFRVIKIPLNGASLATQSIFTLALPLPPGVETAQVTADDQPQQQAQPESINDLVGDIARDFNDVLVNLTEHTRLALNDSDGTPSSEITDYLGAVMNSSQRARDLVAQMMAYQTTDAGSAQSGAADLTLFVSGIVELLRNTIGQHLQISSDLQQNLQVVEIDSLRLQNALIQLFRVAQRSFDSSGHLSVCLRTLTQQVHECAYCYGKVRGDFVVVSLHNYMHTYADAMESDEPSPALPQDEALLSQIKRIHELLKPYSGHIVLRGEVGKQQSWYVFLATNPEQEATLKLYTRQDAE